MRNLYRHIVAVMTAVLTNIPLSGQSFSAREVELPARWTYAFSHVRPLYEPDTLTIRVLGDIMMHEKQIRSALRPDGSYDFSLYFHLIGDRIKDADIAVANMEFTLAGEPYSGYPCFSAPDQFADYLAGCGFDIFLAANNHIFDKGNEGAERTLDTYRRLGREHGINFTGLAGDEKEMERTTPLFIRKKGISLALLNFTYGTNLGLPSSWPKTNYEKEVKRLGKALEKAGKTDVTIVFPHWGEEYMHRHSESQRKTAEWLAKQGTELIIGSHPHVVQNYEVIDNVQLAYSLGNAVSNMSATDTQLGLMATIRIVRKADGDIVVQPVELEYLWCSRPGGYNDSYTVIPVKEFMDRKEEWKNQSDYWKMVTTYNRVSKETGIYQ